MWVEELKEYVCNGTLTSIQLKILLERLSGMSYEAIRTITDVNLNRPMNLIRPIRLKKIFLAGTRIIIFKNVYACTSNTN